jgi:hypothetical protein
VRFERFSKSKLAPGKVFIIFSDISYSDGPQEGFIGFQHPEMGASSSWMASLA